MPHTYKYPRPALTVDCVIFGLDVEDDELQVLLIERGGPPFKGQWAIPGGFVEPGEAVDDAAWRELEEETGLKDVFLEQLYTFGAPDRDPREHVVSVTYYALVNLNEHEIQAGTDAKNAAWFSINDAPNLAFDHETILEKAIERLRGKVRYQPIGFELLPKKFTLTQLQILYEVILERKLDKRNFRRKVLAMGILKDRNQIQQDVRHRAAKLYSFDEKAYRKLEKEGFNFEI
ncbi:MAG: NUDIX domain-containing protein [Verrucomicrobiota bacterium]